MKASAMWIQNHPSVRPVRSSQLRSESHTPFRPATATYPTMCASSPRRIRVSIPQSSIDVEANGSVMNGLMTSTEIPARSDRRGDQGEASSMAIAGERTGAALVIGVGEYLHAEQVWPLRYAARDAEAMATLLIDLETCGFPDHGVKLLTDVNAGRDAIAHHLSKWLPERRRGPSGESSTSPGTG